jgi:hypothetical protein
VPGEYLLVDVPANRRPQGRLTDHGG